MGQAYNIKLPNKFGIDFVEPEYPMSEQDKILRDDWALKNGQKTLAEIMVRDNKDITIEEAERRIEGNIEKNSKQMMSLTPNNLKKEEDVPEQSN